MLKIHEVTRADGSLSPVFLRSEGAELVLASDEGTFPLPDGALDGVMAHYGLPVEPGERLIEVASLELSAGAVLRHVRHLARYDVIARDFLLYARPDQEAVCALATTVAAALAHLGRAAQGG